MSIRVKAILEDMDTAQIENEQIEKIQQVLENIGHPVESIKPVNAQTQFPETPEILEIRGEVVKGIFQDLALVFKKAA